MIRCNVRRHSEETFAVWRCGGCASIHPFPHPPEFRIERYYEGYPVHGQLLTPVLEKSLLNRLRFLRRHGMRPDSRLLDYGCGTGLFVELARREGHAAATGYEPYTPAFADPGALRDGYYDIVTAQDVIEHVEDPKALLAKLAGVVRPGGLVVIGTPRADRLDLARPDKFILEFHQPYHLHLLSEQALHSLGAGLGLRAVACSERFYVEGPLPGMSLRFSRAYVRAHGGVMDVLFEPPRTDRVVRSPRLLLTALLGALIPARGNMTVVFAKAS